MRTPFKHIVGVDPSGALSPAERMPCDRPLNASDAACVSTVHTAWDDTRPAPLLGHVAFFPHGIRRQPHAHARRAGGEGAEACEETALALWAEAVRRPRALVGRHCASWQSFALGLCQGEPALQMRHCDGLAGRFYLRTHATEPFGLGMEGASPPPPPAPTSTPMEASSTPFSTPSFSEGSLDVEAHASSAQGAGAGTDASETGDTPTPHARVTDTTNDYV
ncbi:Uncharacterized protein GBIM_03796 [Gryllus bimaculatus]|nr:Uncharacterized protein GBIM_03796 [Gryllus bimaculatus]